MILAPLAVVLLTATQPDTSTLLQTRSPAPATVIAPRASLREAAIDAARRAAPSLEQASTLRRGRPARLSGRMSGRAVAIGLGVLAGFVGGLAIGPAMSGGECMSPNWLWMSTTAGGGTVGWLLTRR